MTYRLFLDDERMPAYDWTTAHLGDWVIVRSFKEATEYVLEFGCPTHISFDHDLSHELTGYDFANWLINKKLDGIITIPSNFTFYVHSMNPVGAENIRRLMTNFLKFANN